MAPLSRSVISTGVSLKIAEQVVRRQMIELIDKASGLDRVDLESFNRWAQASYEALEFDPLQQQRFDEHCRSSGDTTSMRLFLGVWILRQSLSS